MIDHLTPSANSVPPEKHGPRHSAFPFLFFLFFILFYFSYLPLSFGSNT